MDKLGIPHIPISPYNSKANGVVERGHFIIREAIVKSCGHQMNLWPKKVPAAFFSDRITVSQVTGYSPYFLLHGVEPVLPFDLVEATFLVEGFKSGMAPEDLLVLRMRQLEKRPEDIQRAAFRLTQCRMKSKSEFEKKFQAKLMKSDFNPGELVLVRNSQVMKQMNRKTMPRYLGPYEVVRRTKGGSYVLKELSGTIRRDSAIAASRLYPYIARDAKQLEKLSGTRFEDQGRYAPEEEDDEDNGTGSDSDSLEDS